MYSVTNYKTKKALKEAVAQGKEVRIFQPNDLFGNPKASAGYTGSATLEGPHYPAPHSWYAQVELVEGKIVKVK